MNPQYYQPLSAALHAPVVTSSGPAQYADYGSHARDTAASGSATQHREEEEEEEEDDEEVVEEELDHHDTHHPASGQSSPRTAAPTSHSTSGFTGPGGATISHQYNTQPVQDQANQSLDADSAEKRKPGRPRGSRNRKPRAPPSSSTKAPVNSQHPGFYQYPPAPGAAAAHAQNQQFYEFQWRALNLCSEFYNAAEELVKAASPIVIAQCYQMGPATKIDPLAMISEAKRVCDSLLANPSQLVGTSPPPAAMYPPVPSYPTMPPPPPTNTSASSSGSNSGSVPVITNPQSFVMSLGTPPVPQGAHPQTYYPPMYAQPGSRYPTTPYYSYAPQPAAYYPQPPQQSASAAPSTSAVHTNAPTPTPAPTSVSAPPPTTGTLSTFNAATGNAAPGGQQGTWSEEETERLRKLAEQSRDIGGAQSKGEIEWDWVVHQWGNSRTRHQILLKATSMGLKESTTRGTKRRRENENAAPESASTSLAINPPAQATLVTQPQPPQQAAQAPPAASPIQSPATTSATVNSRPGSSSTPTMAPNRISSGSTSATTPSAVNLPWPMPTVAANTPSPVIAHAQTEAQRSSSNYYRPRPTQATPYSTTAPSPTTSSARPPSSHGSNATHDYMYRPNGTQGTARRQNGI